MLKIRTIQDTISETNKKDIRQVQDIIRQQLPNESEEDIEAISDYLQNPMKYRFRAILYIAEDIKGIVQGFTLLLHFSDLSFCMLEYLLARDENKRESLLEGLYLRAKEDAQALKTLGVFIESGPDRAAQCS
ncbi:MAG: acetylpolyamine amidohydrolase, partial [Elusimicrobiota bacterium]|nr:acetylpolyamine amidohydrolase [Elusimicrobiota bacterium]